MTIPTTATFAILAGLPLFKGVGDDALQGMLASSRLATHEKGHIFLEQGLPVGHFYVILEGWCGACKGNAAGQQSILQIFQRGDFLPEPDAVAAEAETSPVDLQALTQLHLLVLTPAAVRGAMEKSAALSANMLTASAQRCRDMRDHIEQLTLHTAEERVGRFLLQMRFNISGDGDSIILPFDKSLIAAYLGIKPETFSRALQFFKEKGFIVERNQLSVPDRQALCDYCDQAAMKTCRFAHTDDCMHSAHNEAAF